jgi:hypothetical protein
LEGALSGKSMRSSRDKFISIDLSKENMFVSKLVLEAEGYNVPHRDHSEKLPLDLNDWIPLSL